LRRAYQSRLWTHPRDRSPDYNTLSYWTDQAKLLERGLFDGLFIADIVGVYDVYGGGIDVTARESMQLPVNDPTLLVSAMAAVTGHVDEQALTGCRERRSMPQLAARSGGARCSPTNWRKHDLRSVMDVATLHCGASAPGRPGWRGFYRSRIAS
jgi:hypothetical protein